jgi:hypothetical protein
MDPNDGGVEWVEGGWGARGFLQQTNGRATRTLALRFEARACAVGNEISMRGACSLADGAIAVGWRGWQRVGG